MRGILNHKKLKHKIQQEAGLLFISSAPHTAASGLPQNADSGNAGCRARLHRHARNAVRGLAAAAEAAA